MFESFIAHKLSWLSGEGPESNIVFSSRIRLARNISDFPFPSQATIIQNLKILSKIKSAYSDIKGLEDSIFIDMDTLSSLDKQFLLERHLISQEHTIDSKGKGLIVSRKEDISIMINEEDHIRLQTVTSGLDLKKCWTTLNDIDNELNNRVSYSFLADLGYLTSCPTNLGTAMRASCMLHLPALILTKRINKILELLARIFFTARGLFGEGTQAFGDFFQISNQVSLGLSEEEIIDNLIGVVKQVKDQELGARETLMKKYKVSLEDNVWRALGILKNCRLINSKEALSHLSILSLGCDLGIIKDIDILNYGQVKKIINSLFITVQPAHLQKIQGKSIKEEEERDFIRAALLRERLEETIE